MKNMFTNGALIMVMGLGSHAARAQEGSAASKSAMPGTVTIDNGIATFSVQTNITAIEVSGKSTAVQARVQVRHDGLDTAVQHIEARMPVKSLNTGMGLRDEHMRRHIFTTASGDIPDLRFESGEIDCPAVSPGREITCVIAGSLAIRDVPRAFSMSLKLRHDGAALRASGDGTIKLADYGIERPTQLGVKIANEVKIHLDLSSREVATMTAAVGR
jgi:polyisoprenoid-binding protein YceI